MVSSEASPWAKSGGLADVLGALPAALAKLGHPVATVIPRYLALRTAAANRLLQGVPIFLAGRVYPVSVWEAVTAGGPRVFFVEQPELFDRPGLYGNSAGDFPDNHLRFALLCRAAIEVSRRVFPTDIIHCHDWQAGLVPAYLRDPRVADPALFGIRTVLTIHNLGYQGLFDRALLNDVGLPAEFDDPDGVELWGQISFLKAGIVFADALTTVSRKYAEEIQTPEYGFGLDGLLRERRRVLHGILNGADYSRWDPQTDPLIPARYSAADLSGKQTCKRELLREMGLPPIAVGRPLIGIVSRFAAQKGFDLIGEAAEALLAENVHLAVLGNGEARWETLFRSLHAKYPDRIAVKIGYDDALAHRIEAGSDIFLMPSRYEPCGLNQIYSLRYGTVPVVRATGGLEDTIEAAPGPGATGFKFHDYNGKALVEAVRLACRMWTGRKAWTAMMVRGMQKDFSWAASAAEYSRLYRNVASFVA
ncbi:MAG TPA: glycogen synthase GlgA [Bryobacteraceae bacterium]|jgi:starch synthase|nr:glycogen synthase GlgA [Bryobacteraceae bacterium]